MPEHILEALRTLKEQGKLQCQYDVRNPCDHQTSLESWNGKHWGGSKACPNCVIRHHLIYAGKE